MTIIDSMIKIYVWQLWGGSIVSQLLSLVSFTLVLTVALGQKGIYISWWVYPLIFLAIEMLYIFGGYLFKRWDIQNRIMLYSNQVANPQLIQLCNDTTEIKKILEGRR
jgi:hypothetical protein